jgi:hypothetical protein
MRSALLLVAALTASAGANTKPKLRPPTKAEQAALDLATEWVAKLAGDPRSLTSPKLVSIALTDEAGPCPMATSAARGLPCLQANVTPKGKPTIWRHTLGGPLAAHAATINQLAKGAIVVQLDEGCDGSDNQLLLVIKNKLVIGVFAQTYECSE